jgi:hypothetical protein
MDLIQPAERDRKKRDIRTNEIDVSTGYLATSIDEYAECVGCALDNYKESTPLRQRARIASQIYSDELFEKIIVKVFDNILN